MKTIIWSALLVFSLGCLASGVRGGGETTIDTNGYPELLELVKTANYTCEWVNGLDFVASGTNKVSFERIMEALAKLDQVFADDLKAEIASLNFCLTGELVRIKSNRYDDIITPVYKNSKQTAIRINAEVYGDKKEIESLQPRSQVYLAIHEALHGYIPLKIFARQLKLRTAVAVIENVELGKITDTADLHRQMQRNAILFPFSTFAPRVDIDFLRFLDLSVPEKIKWSLRQSNLPKRLKPTQETLNWIAPQAEKYGAWLTNPYESLVNAICGSPKLEPKYMQHIFNDLERYPFAEANLALVCLSSAGSKSDVVAEVIEVIGGQGGLQNVYDQYFQKVMSRGFTITDRRLVANAELIRFLGVPSWKKSAYIGIKEAWGSKELNSLAVVYVILSKDNRQEELDRLFWQNPRFKEVISIYDLATKADSAQPPVVREASHARLQSQVLFTQILFAMARRIEIESDVKTAREFVEKLMNLNPGYYINKNIIHSTKYNEGEIK